MAAQVETALYVVATPIGNLGDITLRALEILKSVDIIACEDTRITSRLCEKYDIKTRLVSYHKFSESSRSDLLLEYLREGKSVALVSDAGTPLISDPGEILVKNTVSEGFKVVPIAGPSAICALLSSVPRSSEDFKFVGFLPRVKKQMQQIFYLNRYENLIFYESPNRIKDTLNALLQIRPQAYIALGRELTKKFEDIKTGPIEDILKNIVTKGEFVCMIYADKKTSDDIDIAQKASVLKELKLSEKDIVNILCSLYELPKNKVKEALYKLQG